MSDNPLTSPVKRRDFLRLGLFGATAAGLGAFGVSFVGMLYPGPQEGFGSAIAHPESPQALYDRIVADRTPDEFNVARSLVVAWDPSQPGAQDLYGENHVMLSETQGLMALSWKCVHLGCKVPWCQTSQWFECPCHGSKYNRYGEYVGGPAPRGLDRYTSFIDDEGRFVIDTGDLQTGPARTANVLQQAQEGPNCTSL